MRAIFQKQMTRRKVEPVKTAENGTHGNRESELRRIFDGVSEESRALVEVTVEKVLYLEERMAELEKLPMIKVHPADPTRQKATDAAKHYLKYLQQHTNCIKLLASVLHKDAPEEESPLRQWLAERAKQNGA